MCELQLSEYTQVPMSSDNPLYYKYMQEFIIVEGIC